MAVRFGSLVALLLALLFPALMRVQAQDFEALGRTLAAELASRQFDKVEAQFDARMAEALPVEKLSSVWDQVLGQAGAFKGVTGARLQDYQGYHIVFVTTEFEQATLDVKVVLDSSGHVAGLFFLPSSSSANPEKSDWSAPDYAKPSAFLEQQVTVGGGQWQLPGILTLPTGNGPFPAVVLVQGSGPSDEDETIGPNKPFKDLAVGLASQGVAVFRYIKRTAKYRNSVDVAGFTADQETTLDAIAAVTVAAHQPEIDASRLVVLGHSFGGTMAPRIALRDPQVAGLVILAGSSRPLEKVIVEQLKYLGGLQPSAQAAAAVAQAEQAQQVIESSDLKPTDSIKLLGTTIPGSYFLDLRSYFPAAAATALKIPILILQAARDYQVTIDDFNTWRESLGNKPNVSFKLYPSLFHLFMISSQPGNSLGGPNDYQQPGHIVGNVIDDIARWVLHLPAPKSS